MQIDIPDIELLKMLLSLSIISAILLLTSPYRATMRASIAMLLVGTLGWFTMAWQQGEMGLTFLFGCLVCLGIGQAVRLIGMQHVTVMDGE